MRVRSLRPPRPSGAFAAPGGDYVNDLRFPAANSSISNRGLVEPCLVLDRVEVDARLASFAAVEVEVVVDLLLVALLGLDVLHRLDAVTVAAAAAVGRSIEAVHAFRVDLVFLELRDVLVVVCHLDQLRSKRSRFMTLFQAATKS